MAPCRSKSLLVPYNVTFTYFISPIMVFISPFHPKFIIPRNKEKKRILDLQYIFWSSSQIWITSLVNICLSSLLETNNITWIVYTYIHVGQIIAGSTKNKDSFGSNISTHFGHTIIFLRKLNNLVTIHPHIGYIWINLCFSVT